MHAQAAGWCDAVRLLVRSQLAKRCLLVFVQVAPVFCGPNALPFVANASGVKGRAVGLSLAFIEHLWIKAL